LLSPIELRFFSISLSHETKGVSRVARKPDFDQKPDLVSAFQAVELQFGVLAANKVRQLENSSFFDSNSDSNRESGTYFILSRQFAAESEKNPIYFPSESAKEAKEFIRNSPAIQNLIAKNPAQVGVIEEFIDFFVENPEQYPRQPGGVHAIIRQAGELAFKAQLKGSSRAATSQQPEAKDKRLAIG